MTEISFILEMGYECLRHEVKAIQKDWRESAVRDFDEAKEIAIRQLEHLQNVYWDAFERSQKQKVRVVEKKGIRGRSKKKLQIIAGETMKEITYGDPSLLLGVRQCIMDIAKIRGAITDSRPDTLAVPITGESNRATFIIMPPQAAPRPIPELKSANVAV